MRCATNDMNTRAETMPTPMDCTGMPREYGDLSMSGQQHRYIHDGHHREYHLTPMALQGYYS